MTGVQTCALPISEQSGKPALAAPKAEAKQEAHVETPEPTKRETKKTAAAPTEKKDLSSVVKAWSDEE